MNKLDKILKELKDFEVEMPDGFYKDCIFYHEIVKHFIEDKLKSYLKEAIEECLPERLKECICMEELGYHAKDCSLYSEGYNQALQQFKQNLKDKKYV